ncbi:hypothetical protein ACFXTN_024947 [Malus domestica]
MTLQHAIASTNVAKGQSKRKFWKSHAVFWSTGGKIYPKVTAKVADSPRLHSPLQLNTPSSAKLDSRRRRLHHEEARFGHSHALRLRHLLLSSARG